MPSADRYGSGSSSQPISLFLCLCIGKSDSRYMKPERGRSGIGLRSCRIIGFVGHDWTINPYSQRFDLLSGGRNGNLVLDLPYISISISIFKLVETMGFDGGWRLMRSISASRDAMVSLQFRCR